MHSPIEQFELHNLTPPLFHLAGQPITITNSTVFMFAAVLSAVLFMYASGRRQAIVPGRWQMMAEMVYNLVTGIVSSAAGPKAKFLTPLIFTLFIFILFCNFWGMVPHTLTVTSQLIVNFALAFFMLMMVIVIGVLKHGLHFFGVFFPSGVPLVLSVFIGTIEIISFFMRSVSLSLRLFINMLAGHLLLKVFASMTADLAVLGWWSPLAILPLSLNIAITGFEFFVALLQAYIFSILCSVYLKDAVELH